MYSIVLVEDHAIVREGFKRLIEMERDLDVVAECRSADDAVEAVGRRRPDLVVLDLSLPDGSGLPLIEHLLSVSPQTRVVVLSMHNGEPYVSEALAPWRQWLCDQGCRRRRSSLPVCVRSCAANVSSARTCASAGRIGRMRTLDPDQPPDRART